MTTEEQSLHCNCSGKKLNERKEGEMRRFSVIAPEHYNMVIFNYLTLSEIQPLGV